MRLSRPITTLLRGAFAVAALFAAHLPAQGVKKPITQDTYDLWKTIAGSTLSPDGQWVAWQHSPVVGDGEEVLRSARVQTEWRFARGFTGRPQMVPNADSTAQFNPPPAQFSGDSKWLAFVTFAPRAEFGATRGGLARGNVTPRNSLTLVSTADGKATVIPHVRSFKFARDGGRYTAYLLETDSTTATPGGAGRAGGGTGGGRSAGRGAPGGGGAPAESPATLVLRDLSSGTETRIDQVTAYMFDDAEKVLAYTTGGTAEGGGNGAWVRELASGRTTALSQGKGNYRSLVLDKKGAQAAFVSDHADAAAARPSYALYIAVLSGTTGQTAPAGATAVATSAQFDGGYFVADHGRVEFTRDGSAVIFALGKPVPDAVPADSLTDKAVYDLWHWQDPVINSVQKLQAPRDRNRTYTAIYHTTLKKAQRLGDDSIPTVTLSENGKTALALNATAYSIDAGWGEGGSDAWIIDATTGVRTLVAKRMRNAPALSPAGKFVLYFTEGNWHSRNVATGKTADISSATKATFFDEETRDTEEPRPFGIAGWTKDDARVLVYDKFDVWELDPGGTAAPVNLTGGAGKQQNVTYRVVDLGREDPALDPAKPLFLRALNNETKESGYYRDKFGVAGVPERLIGGPRNYSGLQKARKADAYMMTQSTYKEYPDLYVGSTIGDVARISNANPQEKEYPRGDVELVSWTSDDGVGLQGMLFKPDGFDPNKKYPMVSYYYEKLSDGLHNYVAPSGRNIINPLVYTSLGYLVFEPDVVYTTGYPGPSAYKCIVSGVQSLIQRGFVDAKRLGLNGQSWGGYETAYIVTQTNMFAAAVPNAAVVNMTSAYDGIRWESGIARQGQYEHGQSRIGGSLWTYPERYISNSPLFQMDRVTTPIFWMENDADGAVPWYQGIEYYLALRRLKKEAYMVVYNGEGHNPSKRANQKDIDLKMQQFFANKLLGASRPEWMVKGVPFLEKNRDQVRMTTAAAPLPEEKRP
ncbi:MAG TPA: prolyl oligopeptidase family serine peptidase [Gemmatimonadaceae bacterium]|nr:prolyl oligopeptidase family serine peptidase [Gemmatimonadaceae bacterium]